MENVEEYTFYKDENFSINNIDIGENNEYTLMNENIKLKRRKPQQNLMNNQKLIG